MRLRDCLIDGDEPFAEYIILYPWRCWCLWSSPLNDARAYLLKWIEDAKDTGIKELLKLVDLVESHMEGILNWYESRINNGVWRGSIPSSKHSKGELEDTAVLRDTAQ